MRWSSSCFQEWTVLIPHSRGGRASPGWDKNYIVTNRKETTGSGCRKGGTRRNAHRHVTSIQRGPQADGEVSGPPAFNELIHSSAQLWARKPNMHNKFSKLHFCILHVRDNSCGMMGWMQALIIHPSCGRFPPASLIVDVFLFRKSLHRQQEGDRRGPNPWTQHIHEGNRTSFGAPDGPLPDRSLPSAVQNLQQWAERGCRWISTGSDISAAVCTSSSARWRCRSLLFALPRAHVTSDRL